jgi:hypothetical protein
LQKRKYEIDFLMLMMMMKLSLFSFSSLPLFIEIEKRTIDTKKKNEPFTHYIVVLDTFFFCTYIGMYIFIAVLTDAISIVGLLVAVMAHHFLFFTYE